MILLNSIWILSNLRTRLRLAGDKLPVRRNFSEGGRMTCRNFYFLGGASGLVLIIFVYEIRGHRIHLFSTVCPLTQIQFQQALVQTTFLRFRCLSILLATQKRALFAHTIYKTMSCEYNTKNKYP